MYFCVVLCIVCFVSFSVLFVCICVLNYCHRVATQLQFKYILSYLIKRTQLNFFAFKIHCISLFLLEHFCLSLKYKRFNFLIVTLE